MKGPLVFMLLLLSLAFASWQFAGKIRTLTGDIDRTENNVRGLKPILQPGAKVALYSANVSFENAFWLRYALAPRHLSTNKNNIYDTALVISSVIPDSLLANRQIIWQNADSQYHYYLTCSPH